MKNRIRKCFAVFTAFCTVAAAIVVPGRTVKAAYSESEASFITFSDTAVTTTGVNSGCSIDGTAVTVSAAGTYVFSGSCADGSITVKKGTKGVKLVLNGLDLTSVSALTGPILCKASTETEIVAEAGTVNNLADSAANAEEKAAIKVNKQSSMVLSGTGTLNVNGMYKNGIKGGTETDITVKEQNLNINSADHGLASDNTVTIKSGKLTIESGGDGIKSSPDRVDDAGNPDDTVSLGDILIEGGEININSAGDGIQGDNSVTINGGSYQITTNGGYKTVLAEDADSCKGIKTDSTLTINGGEFTINSADDAIHSNEYVNILGGIFDIQTGDDGMHADTSLIIGSEEEGSDPDIAISNSYEGLEGGTVYINSGTINVNSSDDGVNAAGGNDGSGGGRPGDGFNPWGGGPGGNRPGGRGAGNSASTPLASEASEYAIYINGGTLYVKAAGDGLDSNGDLYISGGNIIVYGAAAGGAGSDNFPFDHDKTFAITGGTIFGAGSNQMVEGVQSATQGYIVSSRTTYDQGTLIRVEDNQGNVLFQESLAERVNYLMYSSPDMPVSGSSGIYSFKTGATVSQISIEGCQVTLSQDSYIYNGMEHKPSVTVTCEGNTLVRNKDYTVAYYNNTEAGTAKIIITGMGNYTGTIEKEFTILEKTAEGGDNPGSGDNPGNGDNPGTGDPVNPGGESYSKPAKVTGISAVSAGTAKIKISWKKTAKADGYLLYRYDSRGKTWKCIKTISKGSVISYTDSKLASGTAYKYRVCAYVNAGGEKLEGAVSQTVTAATKPAKCSLKKTAAKKNSITLKWKKTSGSGYEITYAQKKSFSGAKTIKVSGASKTSYTIRKLKSKKIYYVKVRAYTKVGNKMIRGSYSARKTVRTK